MVALLHNLHELGAESLLQVWQPLLHKVDGLLVTRNDDPQVRRTRRRNVRQLGQWLGRVVHNPQLRLTEELTELGVPDLVAVQFGTGQREAQTQGEHDSSNDRAFYSKAPSAGWIRRHILHCV